VHSSSETRTRVRQLDADAVRPAPPGLGRGRPRDADPVWRGAAVICGGTELLLLLKLGFAAYGHLVDVKGIESLAGIRVESGTVVIGSTVTHRQIERSPMVLERLPALAAMERSVAKIRVRSIGTLCGNLSFSDPHSDPATFLLALDAEVEYDATRVPLSRFLIGPYETSLDHGQLLRAVHIPIPPPGTGIAHRELAFHERPAATVACVVRTADGLIERASIAVGSVGARAVRAVEAEQLLIGSAPDDSSALSAAADVAAEASQPVEDATAPSCTKPTSFACSSNAASARRSAAAPSRHASVREPEQAARRRQ
jgi:carbon-monoxide dehydrogenase medium subunit